MRGEGGGRDGLNGPAWPIGLNVSGLTGHGLIGQRVVFGSTPWPSPIS